MLARVTRDARHHIGGPEGALSLWRRQPLGAAIAVRPDRHHKFYPGMAGLFRKLGMSWAWALFAFVPFAGQIIQLYAAAYGRRAGIIAASLLAIGIIAP